MPSPCPQILKALKPDFFSGLLNSLNSYCIPLRAWKEHYCKYAGNSFCFQYEMTNSEGIEVTNDLAGSCFRL